MIVPGIQSETRTASPELKPSQAQKTRASVSNSVIAAIIFLLLTALLLAFHANRFLLTNDEGILLIPAQQILHGSRPYVDFFGYMSPGSYWLQALVFKLAGVSLWTGRLIVILDFALQAAMLFWLTAKLAARSVGIAVAIAFIGLQIADPTFLTAQHRWDSATLAMAGLCLALYTLDSKKNLLWIFSGALLATAAWCTPSMAVVGAVVAGWLLLSAPRRASLIPFLGGVVAITLAAVAALLSTGSLLPFLNQMLWLKHNYGEVNTLPYGAIIGGYRNLMEGSSSGAESAVRMFIIAGLALPAVLPPLVAIVWGVVFWRKKVPATEIPIVQLLLLATVAQVLSVFPRADIMHLAFVAAIPYALLWSGIAKLLSTRFRPVLLCGSVLLALPFASNYFVTLQATAPVSSPIGTLRVPNKTVDDVENLLRTVRPGQTLYVHPYMPIHYYLTQAVNPTRYPYLAPGMMTSAEEKTVLAELQQCPPQWLLYMQLSRNEFLRVFPNAINLNWRFPDIDAWLQQNYKPLESPKVSLGGYQLWTRIDTQVSTCDASPQL
jgi:hypothetical protein